MIDRISQSLLVGTVVVVLVGIVAFLIAEGASPDGLRAAVGWYMLQQAHQNAILFVGLSTALALLLGWLFVRSHAVRVYEQDIKSGAVPLRDVGVIDGETLVRHARVMLGAATTGGPATVDRAVDALLGTPVDLGASELRLVPAPSGSDIVLRVGMDDFTVGFMLADRYEGVLQRLRLMVGLDTDLGEGRIDLRDKAAVEPLRIVFSDVDGRTGVRLQVMGRSRAALPLEDLGMTPAVFEPLARALRQTRGLILMSAPLGQGVTTTLYAAAHHINRFRRQAGIIASVEPHVQLEVPFMYQVEVGESVYAAVLRSVLRKGYEVLIARNVSDAQTARLAFDEAKERLVLASLGTSGAVESLTRAAELAGGELLADTLQVALAQRLVPRLCRACRRPIDLTRAQREQAELGNVSVRLYQPFGCGACGGTGFTGMQGVFWLLERSDWLASLLRDGASADQIRAACSKHHIYGPGEAAYDASKNGGIGIDSLIELRRLAGEP